MKSERTNNAMNKLPIASLYLDSLFNNPFFQSNLAVQFVPEPVQTGLGRCRDVT